MSRSQTLVHLDDVPWQAGERVWGDTPGLDVPGGVRVKALSQDPETGARTTILDAPAGWRTPAPEYHSVAQEGLVFGGRETKGSVELVPLTYYYYPPGTVHGPTNSDGHTAIIMLNGPFDVTYVEGSSEPLPPGAQLGVHLDTIPWQPSSGVWGTAGFDVPSGVEVKVLRDDPVTGAKSVLMKVPPGWSTRAPEYHNSLQQELLLEGDVTFAGETFSAPAYFCFPPGAVHGPASTEGGMTMFCTFDGPVDVVYPDRAASVGGGVDADE